MILKVIPDTLNEKEKNMWWKMIAILTSHRMSVEHTLISDQPMNIFSTNTR